MSDFFAINVNFCMHVEDILRACLQTRHFMIVGGENRQTFDFVRFKKLVLIFQTFAFKKD